MLICTHIYKFYICMNSIIRNTSRIQRKITIRVVRCTFFSNACYSSVLKWVSIILICLRDLLGYSLHKYSYCMIYIIYIIKRKGAFIYIFIENIIHSRNTPALILEICLRTKVYFQSLFSNAQKMFGIIFVRREE